MFDKNFIPLMLPDIRDEDIEAMTRVLKSGMLIQGPRVAELESIIANYLGSKYAIIVSNGTTSLYLALKALEIGTGDEVIVPAFSFMATANVVEHVGAKPVFVDISKDTYNIDVDIVEQAITSKTKAIIPVHEFGLACDIKKICALAKKSNLLVVEDAACALGATEDDRFVGTFGNLGCFSFHPRKAITSGEGGVLVTDNDELALKLRTLRNHGIEIIDGKTEFVSPGYNFRMTDFQAALLSSQFNRLDEIIKYKETLAQIYLNELAGVSSIKLPIVPNKKRHTWQSFHILLDDSIDRDNLIDKLKECGVGTNLGAQCIPFQRFFLEKYRLDCLKSFPNAMKAYTKGLVLPLYGLLDVNQVKSICRILKELI
jgi:perosamine synthetase